MTIACDNLKALTKQQLVDKCLTLGIKKCKSKSKKDLILLLNDTQTDKTDQEQSDQAEHAEQAVNVELVIQEDESNKVTNEHNNESNNESNNEVCENSVKKQLTKQELKEQREKEKLELIKELEKFKGAAKVHVSDEQIQDTREKIAKEYAKKFGIKLD